MAEHRQAEHEAFLRFGDLDAALQPQRKLNHVRRSREGGRALRRRLPQTFADLQLPRLLGELRVRRLRCFRRVVRRKRGEVGVGDAQQTRAIARLRRLGERG
jgi:hypothetical protein